MRADDVVGGRWGAHRRNAIPSSVRCGTARRDAAPATSASLRCLKRGARQRARLPWRRHGLLCEHVRASLVCKPRTEWSSRMLRIRVLLCALLTCSALGVGTLAQSQALASHTQADYFEASSDLLNVHTREHTHRAAEAPRGSRAARRARLARRRARVPTARRSRASKRPIQGSTPGAPTTGSIAKAKELGWKVLLTVTAPVPRWATSNHRAPYDTSPNARDFKEFMTAVGRHYGSHVSLFAIWNEPNDAAFLLPQFNSAGQADLAAHLPRALPGRLRRAAGRRSHASQSADRRNRAGRLRQPHPRAKRAQYAIHDVAPLAFLRGMFCLNSHYRKAGSCGALLGDRIRTPRLLHQGRALLRLARARRRHDRHALAPGKRAEPRRARGCDQRWHPDLPDRVRRAEQAQPLPRRLAGTAGRIRRDLRVHRLPRPARRGLLAVPAARRRRRRRARDRGPTAASSASSRASSTSAAAPKPLYFAWPVPLVVSGAATATRSGGSCGHAAARPR